MNVRMILPVLALFLAACQTLPREPISTAPATQEIPGGTIQPTQTLQASPSLTSSPATAPTNVETRAPATDCASIERLAPDSLEAQNIVDEFVAEYKAQYPTEYMGMAILDRVYRLGEWAIVTGSITGEGTDVIAVHQISEGYQIAEFIHIFPLESPEDLETWVIQPFLKKLPEAPAALFTCMDQSWLQPGGQSSQTITVFQLAYVSTDNATTEGVTEIHTLLSDGSNHSVLLHEPMLIMGLVSSPGG